MSLRERQRLVKRDAILDAAMELILEVGYDQMSMEAVAERALITKPTLYTYFPHKLGMAVATYVRLIDASIADRLEGEKHLAPLEKLKFRIRRGIKAKFKSAKLAYGFSSPEVMGHPDYVEAMERYHEPFIRVVKECQALGFVKPELNPALVTHLYIGLCGNTEFEQLLERGLLERAATVETLYRLFLRSILTDETRARLMAQGSSDAK
jgi:AcrR family transcriptional regulator